VPEKENRTQNENEYVRTGTDIKQHCAGQGPEALG
jgi:hypothetical protein